MLTGLFWLCALAPGQEQPTDGLVTTLAALQQFKVAFKQQTSSDFFDDTVAEGTLWVQRPGKMRMEYLVGERRLQIWDGSHCYEHDFAARTEERLDQQEVKDDPLVHILLYGADLRGPFVVQRTREQDGTHYQLSPRDGSDYVVKVTIGANQLPTKIEVIHGDGEVMKLWFHDFDLNPTFPKDAFRVPAPTSP